MARVDKIFHNISRGSLTLGEVMDEIGEFILLKPEREYKIVIGSDSATKNPVSVVSTITIWRVGNGGMYFWTRAREAVFHTLGDRMIAEAMQSILLAQEMKSRLREKFGEEAFWDRRLEVHLDIGVNGETKKFIDTIVGMVKGYGLHPVIKPSSFGASSVADRHT